MRLLDGLNGICVKTGKSISRHVSISWINLGHIPLSLDLKCILDCSVEATSAEPS